MRALPFDENPELVLRVVRKTLRSTGVSVEEIIAAAQSRESVLSANAEKERAAIQQLEQQIATRRMHIESIESELEETSSVRERLEQAIQGETKIRPFPPEVVRLQAEVAAAKAQALSAADAAPAPSPSPDLTKPSAPPAARSGAPPLPKKPFAPKIPGSMPNKATKPEPPPGRAESPGLMNAEPEALDEDASDRPTVAKVD
jgi:translation initiation factor IF-2